MNFKIIGTGSYLPEKKATVHDFLEKGATAELIESWGVHEHRVMGMDETVTDMESRAAKIAIDRAGIKAEDIDLIISGSAMPRQIGVPNANALQYALGAKNAGAFDIVMGCACAIPEFITAAQFVASGLYKCILLTGSCHLTRVADPTDPGSFVVLGDGAGAVLMTASDSDCSICSFDIQSRGEYFNYCGGKMKKPKAASRTREYFEPCDEKFYFYIEDFENTAAGVGRYLLTSVPATVKKSLSKAGLTIEDIDIFISHQNINPLVGNWVKMLGIPAEKTFLTYSKYGNMSAANIFVNLDEALQAGRIKKGDIVVLAGQGAGFSVGSIVMKW